MQLNISVPSYLAKLTHARSISLFYISTDYVFDGTSPPYDIDDTPNPLNFYGKTKYEGEVVIREANPNAVVLRVPILYGHTEYNAESAVNILVDVVMDSGKTVDMDHFAIRYPTNVEDVARVLRSLSDKKLEQADAISGVFHFSGEEPFTKYEMCQVLAKILHVRMDHLRLVDTVPVAAAASRPRDAHLSNRALREAEIDTYAVPFEQWWKLKLIGNK
ncbi:hypothetical protein BC937DRAFT_88145 [Endogone sp. FLAS-F59071]|nr:hypothetical protein BC937DRAFT_88145 [Endogone sp. FLAS-F59071]|eukprot:RUS18943.1 hypothetical protein BC937DRAFT_88145 [Endogone sp. FLAS-F59071]